MTNSPPFDCGSVRLSRAQGERVGGSFDSATERLWQAQDERNRVQGNQDWLSQLDQTFERLLVSI